MAPRFAPGGGSGAENAYLLDGLHAADTGTGLRGTPLHSAFLHELTFFTTTIDGPSAAAAPPVLSPNYGASTAYQPPFALRLGGSLTF